MQILKLNKIKVVLSIKNTTKLQKMLFRFPLNNNSNHLEDNLKNPEIGKHFFEKLLQNNYLCN